MHAVPTVVGIAKCAVSPNCPRPIPIATWQSKPQHLLQDSDGDVVSQQLSAVLGVHVEVLAFTACQPSNLLKVVHERLAVVDVSTGTPVALSFAASLSNVVTSSNGVPPGLQWSSDTVGSYPVPV
jgi:hypothetical protein